MYDRERLGGGVMMAGLPTWTTHKVQHITEHDMTTNPGPQRPDESVR